jgi:multiple sugar transport system substrate-binding protein
MKSGLYYNYIVAKALMLCGSTKVLQISLRAVGGAQGLVFRIVIHRDHLGKAQDNEKERSMKIRKTMMAVTALVLAAGLGLSGCGSNGGGKTEKTADGKLKITMWHGFSEADGKTLEKLVKDFNKSQNKYEIDAQLQPWSTIGETMVTKITSGDGPDIVTTGADNGEGWSIDGTFQCVSDFYNDPKYGTKDYIPNVVKQITFKVDGKEEKCGVPMGYAPTAVWYNTKMWQAAGLTENDYPKTWDELLETAKKLTIPGKQYGMALSDSGWASFLKGNGSGVYTTDGKASINTPENKAFLEKMRDFYKGGYSVKGMDDTKARESFESGQSAMVIVGPWEDQAATDKHIEHDLFPVPDGSGTYIYPDGTKGSNTNSTGLYWWVTSQVKDSSKKQGIYDFMKFYNSKENQITWSLGSAYPPNNTQVQSSDLESRPLIAKIAKSTDHSYIAIAGLKGGFGDIAATVDALTNNTVRKDTDISQLLTTADGKIKGYLDEYSTE